MKKIYVTVREFPMTYLSGSVVDFPTWYLYCGKFNPKNYARKVSGVMGYGV